MKGSHSGFDWCIRLPALALASVFMLAANVAHADCSAFQDQVNRAAAALNTANAQGTAGAGLGGLASNVQAQQYNYNVAVAALNACLRRESMGGSVVGGYNSGGGNRTSQALQAGANMFGNMAAFAGMIDAQRQQAALAAQVAAQQEAEREAQAAAIRAAREAQDARQRAGMGNPFAGGGNGFAADNGNPFAQGQPGRGVGDANNPFAQGNGDSAAGKTDNSFFSTPVASQNAFKCKLGDQTACQAVASNAAPPLSSAQDTVDTLNRMYQGGPTSGGGQPNMIAQARAGYVQQLANSAAASSAGLPALDTANGNAAANPGAGGSGSGSGGSSDGGGNGSGARNFANGGSGGDDAAAQPGSMTPRTKPTPDQINNPFASAKDASEPPMQLGDPKLADLPDRLPLHPQECIDRKGQIINVPGNEYCVVGSDWYHLQ